MVEESNMVTHQHGGTWRPRLAFFVSSANNSSASSVDNSPTMSGTDELCMTYLPIAGRAELVRLIAAAGGLTLHESAELPAGESKSEYLSPSGTPLLRHGDLKLSQSGAIEAYLASIAPKFSGLTPQQRAIDSMYAGIKEEMLSNCAKALFTTKNGEDVTKLLDDRWFPLMEASIPAEGFINGLAFPTVADLVVLNIKTGYSACPFALTVFASRAHIPAALTLRAAWPCDALSQPSVYPQCARARRSQCPLELR